LKGWTPHDIRDEVIDFVRDMSSKTELPQGLILSWIMLSRSKYYDWKKRYGKVNMHNGFIPRDFWLEPWEKDAIITFFIDHPFEGYRRLTYMMMDEDIVAVSPASVYRVLKSSNLMDQRNTKPSKKGTGFKQPLLAHQHWHTDITHINLGGTFYYMCSVLDGFSRYIVHWEIREAMTEKDVEIILLRALEKFPDVSPRLISDNGPQFIAKDFKEFIRFNGMTHVRTSPYYRQSNGKQERMQGLIKQECIRPKCPKSIKQARKMVGEYVEYYNNKRLHSAIGYVAPKDMLEGKQRDIHNQRDRKLELAREQRKQRRIETKCKHLAS
jgi:transposase InsO family protein